MSYRQDDFEFECDYITCPQCGERIHIEAQKCLTCEHRSEKKSEDTQRSNLESAINNQEQLDQQHPEPKNLIREVPSKPTLSQKMIFPIACILCIVALGLIIGLVATSSKLNESLINENSYRELVPELLKAVEEEKIAYSYFYASENLLVLDKNTNAKLLVIYTLKKDSFYYLDLFGDSVKVEWGKWKKSKSGGYENILTITPLKPGWSKLEFYEKNSDERVVVKAFVY